MADSVQTHFSFNATPFTKEIADTDLWLPPSRQAAIDDLVECPDSRASALVTGDSGVGKSELALELLSRGSGLIADDVIELYRIAPETLEGRCPLLLCDFLEVRGLGVLNIRTIFGEAALRPRKNMKLIVHLEKPAGGETQYVDRLPLKPGVHDILGVSISKVTIPVAAGRNLAVLVEAAVRNHVLQLRGIDSTRDFIARQAQHMKNDTP